MKIYWFGQIAKSYTKAFLFSLILNPYIIQVIKFNKIEFEFRLKYMKKHETRLSDSILSKIEVLIYSSICWLIKFSFVLSLINSLFSVWNSFIWKTFRYIQLIQIKPSYNSQCMILYHIIYMRHIICHIHRDENAKAWFWQKNSCQMQQVVNVSERGTTDRPARFATLFSTHGPVQISLVLESGTKSRNSKLWKIDDGTNPFRVDRLSSRIVFM